MEALHCHLVNLVWLVVPGRHGRLGEGLDAERPGLREGPNVA